MAKFELAFANSMRVEGGIANDPNDSGGLTYMGITEKYEPDWEGWIKIRELIKKHKWNEGLINSEAMADAAIQSSVKKLYKKRYWDIMTLDGLNDDTVAKELFDTGLNMGVGTASLFFQRVLNVVNRTPTLVLDGRVGPNTVGAFNSLGANDKYMVWKLLNCLQGAKYIAICEANPTQERFIRSWASRVFEQ